MLHDLVPIGLDPECQRGEEALPAQIAPEHYHFLIPRMAGQVPLFLDEVGLQYLENQSYG